MLITFLEKFQGSFCESSGPKIRLIMQSWLSIILEIPEQFLNASIIDFLLLFPRGTALLLVPAMPAPAEASL